MSDRELLERAAKAAGLVGFEWDEEWQCMSKVEYEENFGNVWTPWRPLEDAGDALRLAVKLSMRLVVDADGTTAASVPDGPASNEPHGTDPFASTRRAIVRAAAEIGSQ